MKATLGKVKWILPIELRGDIGLLNKCVTLYTDLSVDECVSRLSASGWAGDADPRRWRPTASDRNVLRIVDGNAFRLYTRSWQVLDPLPRQGRLPRYFFGRLEAHGQGTRITGRVGFSPVTRLALGLLVLAAVGAMAFHIFRGLGAGAVRETLAGILQATLIMLFVWLLLRWTDPREGVEEAYLLRFMERTLEARKVGPAEEPASG